MRDYPMNLAQRDGRFLVLLYGSNKEVIAQWDTNFGKSGGWFSTGGTLITTAYRWRDLTMQERRDLCEEYQAECRKAAGKKPNFTGKEAEIEMAYRQNSLRQYHVSA